MNERFVTSYGVVMNIRHKRACEVIDEATETALDTAEHLLCVIRQEAERLGLKIEMRVDYMHTLPAAKN